MTAAARLRVDPIACDGRGLCAETLPEMITLDDWGFPIIRAADVPPGLRAAAREAVRLCPLLALRLDRAGRDLAGKMHAMTAGLATGHSRKGCPARH